MHYYWILRAILSANPQIRKYLTRCKYCGIFFLTHPRNAGRRDLRCNFGCRQYHRKENAKERSAKYYRSKKGKERKKALNRRRYLQTDKKVEDLINKETTEQKEEVIQNEIEVEEGLKVKKGILSYLQMVIGLIEGRFIRMDEVLQMLRKIWRQHSIDRSRRFVYSFNYSSQRPP